MSGAKDLILRPIPGREAGAFIKAHHYSGKTVNNSQLHIGVFWRGKLEGAMQFGPSLDKRKMQKFVSGTGWNEFIELNRMAFSDVLPRNSESRAIAVAMRLLRKHAPQLKWVLSFADATLCGDGTIYRASGFVLTGIIPSRNLARRQDGEVVHKMSYASNPVTTGYAKEMGGRNNWAEFCRRKGWEVLEGYQLRYIYFLDKSYRERLMVPEIPFSKIQEMGAGMYLGQKR